MRRLILGILALVPVLSLGLGLGVAGPGAAQAQDKYIFATTPFKTHEEMSRMYAPLMAYLGEQTGHEFSLYIANDYDKLVSAMEKGQADLGHLSPNIYVTATAQIPNLRYLVTILQDQGGEIASFYRSQIIVPADSPVQAVEDLKGKIFAFTDTGSTSGYVFPMALLRRQQIEPDSYFGRVLFLKKHDKVIEAVARGKVDGGAVASHILAGETAAAGGNLPVRIIAETAPIPFPAYAARPDLDPQVADAVVAALQALDKDHPVIRAMQAEGFYGSGYSVMGDSLYDGVREAHQLVGSFN